MSTAAQVQPTQRLTVTHGFPPNSPPVDERIAAAIQFIKLQSLLKVEEFLAAGAMPRELGIWMEEPVVERLADGTVVVHEQMRVL